MKNILYLVILIFFLSCKSKTTFEKPEDLIVKEQMIDLLTDLHLAVSSNNVKDKNAERNNNYMVLVFKKYNIDSVRFESSNMYYMTNIEEYEDMFEEVEKRLMVLKDTFRNRKDTIEEKMRRERKKQIKSFKNKNRTILQ